MIRIDLYTTLHVPPRMLVIEKPDRNGTEIVYLLPSSVFAVAVDGKVDEQLEAAAKRVDEKVETLIRKVIGA